MEDVVSHWKVPRQRGHHGAPKRHSSNVVMDSRACTEAGEMEVGEGRVEMTPGM